MARVTLRLEVDAIDAETLHHPDPRYIGTLVRSIGKTEAELSRVTGASIRSLRRYRTATPDGQPEQPIPYALQVLLELLAIQARQEGAGAIVAAPLPSGRATRDR